MPCQPKHPNSSAHRNRCDKIYENYRAKLANITPSRNRAADKDRATKGKNSAFLGPNMESWLGRSIRQTEEGGDKARGGHWSLRAPLICQFVLQCFLQQRNFSAIYPPGRDKDKYKYKTNTNTNTNKKYNVKHEYKDHYSVRASLNPPRGVFCTGVTFLGCLHLARIERCKWQWAVEIVQMTT